jgi:hypothetical protein
LGGGTAVLVPPPIELPGVSESAGVVLVLGAGEVLVVGVGELVDGVLGALSTLGVVDPPGGLGVLGALGDSGEFDVLGVDALVGALLTFGVVGVLGALGVVGVLGMLGALVTVGVFEVLVIPLLSLGTAVFWVGSLNAVWGVAPGLISPEASAQVCSGVLPTSNLSAFCSAVVLAASSAFLIS